jgi:hypothetical protein
MRHLNILPNREQHAIGGAVDILNLNLNLCLSLGFRAAPPSSPAQSETDPSAPALSLKGSQKWEL